MMNKATNKELRAALKSELSPILLAIKQRVAEGNDLLTVVAASKGLQLIIDGEAKNMPILKGDKGDDGKTPVLGKDYFTSEDVAAIIKAATPVKGKDYSDGEPGAPGDDGKTPKKGKDYYTAAEVAAFKRTVTPIAGVDYFTTKDKAALIKEAAAAVSIPKAAPQSPTELRDALESLKGTQRLSAKAIKGLAELIQSLMPMSSFAGGGSPPSSGGTWGSITGTLSAQTDLNTALGLKANTASLAAVATSGAYADLSGKPSLAAVATSGAYSDLTGKPSLATVATTGAYADLTGKPSLAAVATSGAYSDLTGTPAAITAGTGVTVVSGVVSIGQAIGTGASPTFAGLTMNGDVNANSHRVTNLTDPSSAQDAATKAYVDAAIAGTDYKAAANWATTAALPTNSYSNGSSGVGATITGISVGALSIDGNTPSIGDRIIVKNEGTGSHNGIYVVTTVGSGIAVFVLTRAADFNSSADIAAGDAVFVLGGTTNATTTWVMTTTGTITVGTTSLTFVQVQGAGTYIAGSGITITGMTVALDTSVAATLTATQTLTNKRITQRVSSMADATSITPAGDSNDAEYQSNTQAGGTLTVNAPTGTPTDFQPLLIRIKSTNAQTFSFNAIYRFSTDLAAPGTSTGGGKTDYLYFKYNAVDSKWDYVGKLFGF